MEEVEVEGEVEEAAQGVILEVHQLPHRSPSHRCISWLTWQSRNPGRKRKVREETSRGGARVRLLYF